MGASSSSLLDENRINYITGRAEAELKNFSPHYKRQYSVAFFSQLQDEVEQHKAVQAQLLKTRDPPEASVVLYSEKVMHSEDSRKWKERLVVLRGDYSLECHDSSETFAKGTPPRHQFQLTGGNVLTSEEKYVAMVDKAFPDPNGTKEETAAPVVPMPGQFPVYLRLPYRRDTFFHFEHEDGHARFISILAESIRHQNLDFLKEAGCDVQAFLKAVHFYRQEKGHYESWDMSIGTDVEVFSNLVMEELLPSLQTELLPRLKGKKADRKRVWFATVEAAYLLVQKHISDGLTALKDECRERAKQQEALVRSDMDQIVSSKTFLSSKLQATVTEVATKYCAENVQPYLASILEELMEPVSRGFQEVRQRCEGQMDKLSKEFQEKGNPEELKAALDEMGRMHPQDCYQHVDVLFEQLQELRNRFKFSNAARLVHSAQIDMQQLMENAAHTFRTLVLAALKNDPAKAASATEKAKHRVLKQYDYDSSTIRKRIFQEALGDITLPAIKRSLAPSCKPELPKFDQYIFADYTNFIQVENVYEDILQQILDVEINKVVKEAASMKKHNLFVDSTDMHFVSQASLSDSRTPPRSSPSSPPKAGSSSTQLPSSPLLGNGVTVKEVEKPAKTESCGPHDLLCEEGNLESADLSTEKSDCNIMSVPGEKMDIGSIDLSNTVEQETPKSETYNDGKGNEVIREELPAEVTVISESSPQTPTDPILPLAVMESTGMTTESECRESYTETGEESAAGGAMVPPTESEGNVKAIRDLVVEIIEVEEKILPYPDRSQV